MTTSPLRPRILTDEEHDHPARLNGFAAHISLGKSFRSESRDYFLLLGTTLFMVVFGLIMVLSSSSIESHDATEDFFSRFMSQGINALVGVPLMFVISILPQEFWRRCIGYVLGFACFLQVIVLFTPLGEEIGGNRNWLRIGSQTFQPSELIKFALVIWLGVMVSRKQHVFDDWRQLALAVLPVAGISIGLVIRGGDLGTTVIMSAAVLGALFFAGVRWRYLLVGIGGVSVLALVVAFSSASRAGRIAALFGGTSAANPDVDYQIKNASYGLASGGFFGVGLGNSHSKWLWLPAAETDFIYAVIGEELGLIGAVLVLALFVVLAFSFVRIIHSSNDPFTRTTTAAIMVWLIGQAFVNIGVVLGVIPVLGVPLPLISAGGTALISSLAAIGVVLSFVRAQAKNTRDAQNMAAIRNGRVTG